MLNPDRTVRGTPAGVRVFPLDGIFYVADPSGWIEGEYQTVADAVAASAWGADWEARLTPAGD